MLPPAEPQPLASPDTIHPGLWRASQLGCARQAVVPTGLADLDRELPSGGWPRRCLTELLLKHPGVGEMRLLAPALRAATGPQASRSASLMLFDPPATPCAWAMTQMGLDDASLIVVHGREGPRGAALRHLLASADVLWALEQALRSGHVGAILAWLPDRLRGDALRRLQLAAEGHDGPVFLLRGIEARLKPSPAPLRLALHANGADSVHVQILKRRGPALARTLHLQLPPTAVARRLPLPGAKPVLTPAPVGQSDTSAVVSVS